MSWACNSVFGVSAMHSRQHFQAAFSTMSKSGWDFGCHDYFSRVVTVFVDAVAVAAAVIATCFHGLMLCFCMSCLLLYHGKCSVVLLKNYTSCLVIALHEKCTMWTK